MNGQTTGVDAGTLRVAIAILIEMALFAAGLIYNSRVEKIHETKKNFPNSALVVIGVAFTVAGAWGLFELAAWPFLLANIAAFAASGLPMIAGDLWRVTEERESAAEQQMDRLAADARRKVVDNGDSEKSYTTGLE